VQQLHAGGELEQLAAEMLEAADAGRGTRINPQSYPEG
jgi:hypothetical protein